MTRQRPVPFLLGMDGPSIELPGWVAAWLESNTNLSERRVATRGQDLAIDDVLAKLHYIAVRHLEFSSDPSTDVGTELETATGAAQSLDMTVSEAATAIGITDRAIRKAIQQNRLPARRSGAIWLITRDDLNAYRTTA